MTKQFYRKLFHKSRLNYIVDALFFISMTATMLSGLLISKSVMSTLGIQLNASHGWESIHRLAADTSLVMLGLHFALHFNWVLAYLKRYLVFPVMRLFRRPGVVALATEPARIENNR